MTDEPWTTDPYPSSEIADPRYGYATHLPDMSFEDAKRLVTEALKAEGFGILTEIDVKATLKQKLDCEFRRYVILGACNPQLAHRALDTELGIGLLLPCNVCVWEEEGGTVVSIVRPDEMFRVVNRPELAPIAGEADVRLRRVPSQMSSGGPR